MSALVTDVMSMAALCYGASLALPGPTELAQRLYLYNRYPLSPALRRKFPPSRAVLTYLLSERDGDLASRFDREWLYASSPDGFWASLSRIDHVWLTPKPIYKLYLSPTLDAAPQAFMRVVEELPSSRAVGLKAAQRIETLVRPDKFVVYFDSFEDLSSMVNTLAAVLVGVSGQGVPFACGFDEATHDILSWGIDLPSQLAGVALSWRQWITTELAAGLCESGSRVINQRVEAAFEHIRRKGVDPATWRPDFAGWLKQLDTTHG